MEPLVDITMNDRIRVRVDSDVGIKSLRIGQYDCEATTDPAVTHCTFSFNVDFLPEPGLTISLAVGALWVAIRHRLRARAGG